FFFLIAVLTALDLIIYVFCARWYKGFQAEGSENIENQEDDETINKV
ncbi:peptide/nitrate transporter, partial [Trifolium medium]|nr:peptide/nitrate transporter [Trifolium medium]